MTDVLLPTTHSSQSIHHLAQNIGTLGAGKENQDAYFFKFLWLGLSS